MSKHIPVVSLLLVVESSVLCNTPAGVKRLIFPAPTPASTSPGFNCARAGAETRASARHDRIENRRDPRLVEKPVTQSSFLTEVSVQSVPFSGCGKHTPKY